MKMKQCGIDNKEERIIRSILSKLGPEYSVFVSTFHATKLVVRNWRIPSLDAFIDSLTQEQDKLVQMGTLSSSKDHVLASHGAMKFRNAKAKGKQRMKEKKHSDEESSSSPNEDSKANKMR